MCYPLPAECKVAEECDANTDRNGTNRELNPFPPVVFRRSRTFHDASRIEITNQMVLSRLDSSELYVV